MALQDARVAGLLALIFGIGVLFQFLGCALWHNWWPMLAAFVYVLVPMPHLFFGGSSYGPSPWVDAGKFLTGFSTVASIAVPAMLYHAGKIALGALWMELTAVAIMGGSLLAWDYLSEQESGGFYAY